MPYYSVRGQSLKTMLDLSTSEARGTTYNNELAAALTVSDIHIELRAYDFDTHEDWSDSDFVFGKLIGYTDEELLKNFEDTIGSRASYETNIITPIGHYSSALSEFVYQIPSIVIYVNVGSTHYTVLSMYEYSVMENRLLWLALFLPVSVATFLPIIQQQLPLLMVLRLKSKP